MRSLLAFCFMLFASTAFAQSSTPIALTPPQTLSGTSAVSPLLSIVDSAASSINSISYSALSDVNGINIKMCDAGGCKTLRVASGALQVLNNAYSGTLLTITDTGATTLLAGSAALTLGSTAYTTCTALTTTATVVGCTVSSKRFKNQLGAVPDDAIGGLMNLPSSVFSYKDQTAHGLGQHFGLYAEDVCAIDERLCVRDPESKIVSYDDRGVLALLVGQVQELHREIDRLKQR